VLDRPIVFLRPSLFRIPILHPSLLSSYSNILQYHGLHTENPCLGCSNLPTPPIVLGVHFASTACGLRLFVLLHRHLCNDPFSAQHTSLDLYDSLPVFCDSLRQLISSPSSPPCPASHLAFSIPFSGLHSCPTTRLPLGSPDLSASAQCNLTR